MWCAWTISRARLAVALVMCVLAAGASAQPSASEQSRGGEQRQDAQEPQAQARDASPAEQPESPAQARQGEHRDRAEDNPKDGGSETGLLAWAKGWWLSFVGFVEANDKFLVALGTLVTAAFTAILGGATIGLFVATRNLVKGSERSLTLAQRAWLKVGAAVAAPLRVSPRHIQVTLDLKITNTGQTPALRVRPRVKAYLATQATHDAAAEQRKVAERMSGKTSLRETGDVVFPKQTIVQRIITHVSQAEIEAALAEDGAGAPSKVEVMLVGTVAYHLAFADEVHHTGFIYRVVEVYPDYPLASWRIDVSAGEIPPERWRFQIHTSATPRID